MRRFLALILSLTLFAGPSNAHKQRTLPTALRTTPHNAAYIAWKHAEFIQWRHALYLRWEARQRIIAAWTKVNVCEEGGNWHVRGSRFSGGLGISNANWVIFGGREFAPNGALATPWEQITVARRIQSNPPDQSGCTGAW